MIDPSKIIATKITAAGAKVLVKIDGKNKWVWRDERDKKPTTKPSSFDEYLSR